MKLFHTHNYGDVKITKEMRKEIVEKGVAVVKLECKCGAKAKGKLYFQIGTDVIEDSKK